MGKSPQALLALVKEVVEANKDTFSDHFFALQAGGVNVRSVRANGIQIPKALIKKVQDAKTDGYHDKMLKKAMKEAKEVGFKNPEYYIIPATIVAVASRWGK